MKPFQIAGALLLLLTVAGTAHASFDAESRSFRLYGGFQPEAITTIGVSANYRLVLPTTEFFGDEPPPQDVRAPASPAAAELRFGERATAAARRLLFPAF